MSTSPKPRSRSARLWVLLGLAVLTVLWACGDQNLFGPGAASPPEVVSIQLPQQVYTGQTLDVRAQVVGSVPIDSVLVRVRSAFDDAQAVTASTTRSALTVDVSFEVPDTLFADSAVVQVIAYDVLGSSSRIMSGTVSVIRATAQGAAASTRLAASLRRPATVRPHGGSSRELAVREANGGLRRLRATLRRSWRPLEALSAPRDAPIAWAGGREPPG